MHKISKISFREKKITGVGFSDIGCSGGRGSENPGEGGGGTGHEEPQEEEAFGQGNQPKEHD